MTMLDHVSIGVRDIERTRKFYDATLQPLGYSCLSRDDEIPWLRSSTALNSGLAEPKAPCRPIRNPDYIFVSSRRPAPP